MPNWTTTLRNTSGRDTAKLIKQGTVTLLAALWVVLVHRAIIDLVVSLYTLVQTTLTIATTGGMVWGIIYLVNHPEVLKGALKKIKV